MRFAILTLAVALAGCQTTNDPGAADRAAAALMVLGAGLASQPTYTPPPVVTCTQWANQIQCR